MEDLIVFEVLCLRRQNRLKVDRRDEILRGVEDKSLEEQRLLLGDHYPGFQYCY